MNIPTLIRGLAVGVVAGAAIDMMACSTQKHRKTTVGKALQRMGNAMDTALDGISDRLH